LQRPIEHNENARTSDADVVVRVPARAEFVRVLRGVVSTMAAQLALGYDEISDVRLAVDEACAHVLAADPPGDWIEVRADIVGDRLEIVAASNSAGAAWPPTGARHSLAWQVLNALTEDVSFERTTEEGPAVRFAKRVRGAEIPTD
jgi:serine/threonine-protein kinase RsbW